MAMAAFKDENIDLSPAEKLVETLFIDFKTKPTKKNISFGITKESLEVMDSMRHHAKKIVSVKVPSRNDILEKISKYFLDPDSTGFVSTEDIINQDLKGKGKKIIICFNLPSYVISLINDTAKEAGTITGKKISRSYLVETLIQLASK